MTASWAIAIRSSLGPLRSGLLKTESCRNTIHSCLKPTSRRSNYAPAVMPVLCRARLVRSKECGTSTAAAFIDAYTRNVGCSHPSASCPQQCCPKEGLVKKVVI